MRGFNPLIPKSCFFLVVATRSCREGHAPGVKPVQLAETYDQVRYYKAKRLSECL